MFGEFKRFLKEIDFVLGPTFKNMGFKRKSNDYIRIVNNQILQVINLQKTSYNNSNRVMINITSVPMFSNCRMSIRWIEEGKQDWDIKDIKYISDIISTILEKFKNIVSYEKLLLSYEKYILNPPKISSEPLVYWSLEKGLYYTYGYSMFYDICIRLDRKDLLASALEQEKEKIKDLELYFLKTDGNSKQEYINSLKEQNKTFEKDVEKNYDEIRDKLIENELINLKKSKKFMV